MAELIGTKAAPITLLDKGWGVLANNGAPTAKDWTLLSLQKSANSEHYYTPAGTKKYAKFILGKVTRDADRYSRFVFNRQGPPAKIAVTTIAGTNTGYTTGAATLASATGTGAATADIVAADGVITSVIPTSVGTGTWPSLAGIKILQDGSSNLATFTSPGACTPAADLNADDSGMYEISFDFMVDSDWTYHGGRDEDGGEVASFQPFIIRMIGQGNTNLDIQLFRQAEASAGINGRYNWLMDVYHATERYTYASSNIVQQPTIVPGQWHNFHMVSNNWNAAAGLTSAVDVTIYIDGLPIFWYATIAESASYPASVAVTSVENSDAGYAKITCSATPQAAVGDIIAVRGVGDYYQSEYGTLRIDFPSLKLYVDSVDGDDVYVRFNWAAPDPEGDCENRHAGGGNPPSAVMYVVNSTVRIPWPASQQVYGINRVDLGLRSNSAGVYHASLSVENLRILTGTDASETPRQGVVAAWPILQTPTELSITLQALASCTSATLTFDGVEYAGDIDLDAGQTIRWTGIPVAAGNTYSYFFTLVNAVETYASRTQTLKTDPGDATTRFGVICDAQSYGMRGMGASTLLQRYGLSTPVVTTPGTGATEGTYTGVKILEHGVWHGATATVVVTGTDIVTADVTITKPGLGYTDGYNLTLSGVTGGTDCVLSATLVPDPLAIDYLVTGGDMPDLSTINAVDDMLYIGTPHTWEVNSNGIYTERQADMRRAGQTIAGITARGLLVPTLGNHEGSPPLHPDEGFDYWLARVPQPANNYSFDYGYAHITCIIPSVGGGWLTHEIDWDWLEADLRATDRPWKVVVMHYPGYGNGEDTTSSERPYKYRWELHQILERNGVAAMIGGHCNALNFWNSGSVWYVMLPTPGSSSAAAVLNRPDNYDDYTHWEYKDPDTDVAITEPPGSEVLKPRVRSMRANLEDYGGAGYVTVEETKLTLAFLDKNMTQFPGNVMVHNPKRAVKKLIIPRRVRA